MSKQLFFLLFMMLCVSCYSCTFKKKSNDQEDFFKSFKSYTEDKNFINLNKGDRIILTAKYFLSTPYVGGTLDRNPNKENLVVNFKELDCMTFVETVLALNKSYESDFSFDGFTLALKNLRYRNGALNNYISRLHYTSEWIVDNIKKNNIDTISMGENTVPLDLSVSIMSNNPQYYKSLQIYPKYIPLIKSIEDSINSNIKLRYLPKEKVTEILPFANNGDVVCFTSSIKGIDFSHLGFIYIGANKVVYLLHASSDEKKVVLSKKSLKDYLFGIKRHTGIVLIRMK